MKRGYGTAHWDNLNNAKYLEDLLVQMNRYAGNLAFELDSHGDFDDHALKRLASDHHEFGKTLALLKKAAEAQND